MVDNDAALPAAGSARTVRLYGNYAVNAFERLTVDNGNDIFRAGLDGYIIDDLRIGGYSTTLSAALKAYYGNEYEPAANKWFSFDYKIDGSRHNGMNAANKPADDFIGPLIFGLGIPGQNDPTVVYITNVVLLGKGDVANVAGKPYFIIPEDEEDALPVFIAYGNTNGSAGEDVLARIATQGTYPAAYPEIPKPKVTITFDLNAEDDITALFDDDEFAGSIQIKQGNQIGTLPTASRDGYIFMGWALAADDNNPIASTTTFATDATVYAIWEEDVAEGDPIDLELTISDLTLAGGMTAVNVTDGIKVTYGQGSNNDYGSPNAWFKLDLAELELTAISDIKSIKFDFTPVSGDVSSKGVYLVAADTAHGWVSDDKYVTETISTTQALGVVEEADLGTAISVTLIINQTKITEDSVDGDFFFSIRINASNKGALGGTPEIPAIPPDPDDEDDEGTPAVPAVPGPTSYSITNIQLIPFAN